MNLIAYIGKEILGRVISEISKKIFHPLTSRARNPFHLVYQNIGLQQAHRKGGTPKDTQPPPLLPGEGVRHSNRDKREEYERRKRRKPKVKKRKKEKIGKKTKFCQQYFVLMVIFFRFKKLGNFLCEKVICLKTIFYLCETFRVNHLFYFLHF